jgi:hypothetical protein
MEGAFIRINGSRPTYLSGLVFELYMYLVIDKQIKIIWLRLVIDKRHIIYSCILVKRKNKKQKSQKKIYSAEW